MTSSFAVYFINRRTAGISRDFDGYIGIKYADNLFFPREYSCILPDTNGQSFYVFYCNEMQIKRVEQGTGVVV